MGDYRRYLDKNTVRLGPVASAVQRPHTEGAVRPERSRYIALCCFEPLPYLAETGMADLHEVCKSLPGTVRAKFDGAWNRFYYLSSRKLTWLDRRLLRGSPLQVVDRPDGRADLALAPGPLVCAVPETATPAYSPGPSRAIRTARYTGPRWMCSKGAERSRRTLPPRT